AGIANYNPGGRRRSSSPTGRTCMIMAAEIRTAQLEIRRGSISSSPLWHAARGLATVLLATAVASAATAGVGHRSHRAQLCYLFPGGHLTLTSDLDGDGRT